MLRRLRTSRPIRLIAGIALLVATITLAAALVLAGLEASTWRSGFDDATTCVACIPRGSDAGPQAVALKWPRNRLLCLYRGALRQLGGKRQSQPLEFCAAASGIGTIEATASAQWRGPGCRERITEGNCVSPALLLDLQ